MKTTITLNGITQEIELTPEQERLFKKPKTGWERVERGDEYYWTNKDGGSGTYTEIDDETDGVLYKGGFYHSTKEHAIKQAKIDSLRRRMQRFADENYPDVEWDGESNHWIIFFDGSIIFTGVHREVRHPFQIYFGTEVGARRAIELFGAEIKEMMGI